MSGAPMLHVRQAPPFATTQDLGRPGWRQLGVPAGGAMDEWALRTANALVGNDEGAAALEWALGGGMVAFDSEATIALAGAPTDARVDDRPLPMLEAHRVPAGRPVVLAPPRDGRFVYLAVGGGLVPPMVLGSRSTYLPAGFGGLAGRRLASGDVVPLGPAHDTVPTGRRCPPDLAPPGAGDDGPIRLVVGPQADALDADGWRTLLEAPFHVATTGDRTGYRLDGPPLAARDAATLPSEPGCPGALQLPPGGRPIVLLADAPTVGGYPKPAVVCRADLGRVAQALPGQALRFALVDVATAQRLYRRARIRVDTIGRLGR